MVGKISYSRITADELIDTNRTLLSLGQADTTLLIIETASVFTYPHINCVGYFEALIWLLKQEHVHFDPNQRMAGLTPLMNIARNIWAPQKKLVLLNLLVQAGADVDVRADGRYGCFMKGSALHMIISLEQRYFKHWHKAFDAIQPLTTRLLEVGADPHLVDTDGHTPTSLATMTSPATFMHWRQVVHDRGFVEDFIKTDLETRSFLYRSGWSERALKAAFYIDFAPIELSGYRQKLAWDRYRSWNERPLLRDSQAWWYDLLELIRLGRKPISPLRRGWHKITGCNGSVCYVHRPSGRVRSKRPQSLLLSNLRSERSQERYKQGKIVIEAEDVTESETQSTEEQYADDQETAYSYSFISGETDDDSQDEADFDEDESDDSLSEIGKDNGEGAPDTNESRDDNEAEDNLSESNKLYNQIEPDSNDGQESDSTESEASENFEDAIEMFGSRFR